MPTAQDLRRDLDTLVTLGFRDLRSLFDNPSTDKLFDLLPALVVTYGQAASTTAANWYDDVRDQKAIRRAFTAIPAELGDGNSRALIRWAIQSATDDYTFKKLIEGGTQRRIYNWARSTVTESSVADPVARGWQRTGSGECDFCDMLIGRGAVYSEATADFESHDGCRCGAEPVFA